MKLILLLLLKDKLFINLLIFLLSWQTKFKGNFSVNISSSFANFLTLLVVISQPFFEVEEKGP